MKLNYSYIKHPYGMLMPGRHEQAENGYRYGFQGQEGDDEVKGKGNSVNYKYRMHDSRIGRFFAIDPLAPKYPHNSPYAFSENNVIHAVELEGLEKDVIVNKSVTDKDLNSTNTTETMSFEDYNRNILGIDPATLPVEGKFGELGYGTLEVWINQPNYADAFIVGTEYTPYEYELGEENAKKEYHESKSGIRIDLSLRQQDQVYNIFKAADHIRNNVYKEKGACAKYVRMGLEAGGISTWGGPMNRPNSAGDYNDGFLQSRGFHEVSKVNYTPIIGDLTVWEAGPWSEHGHIHMYLGEGKWGSDYIGGMKPYSKYDVPFTIFRR